MFHFKKPVTEFTIKIEENGTLWAIPPDKEFVEGKLDVENKRNKIDELLNKIINNQENEQIMIDLGETLYDFLFCNERCGENSDSIGNVFSGVYKDCIKTGNRLRIVIRSLNSYTQSLPWELLYYNGNFLAAQGNTVSIVRFPTAVPQVKEKRVKGYLKILVILSDAEEKDQRKLVYAREELKKIEDVLRENLEEDEYNVEVFSTYNVDQSYKNIDQKSRPRIDYISERLRDKVKDRFNIIHYIGHSSFDKEKRSGNITLESSLGKPFDFSDRIFSGMFDSDSTSELGLVVLNSCESGVEMRFAGLAKKILKTKLIPCVVGMQFKIKDIVAPDLSRIFYTSLLKNDFDVEEAIIDTRKNLLESRSGPCKKEFAAPVLYYTAESGNIILDFITKYIKQRERKILKKFPGQASLEKMERRIKGERKKSEFSPMVTRDSPMPVYIDNTISALDHLLKLEDGIFRGETDHQFLYWSVKSVKRWRDLCEYGYYPAYQWGHKIIQNRLDDMFLSLKNDSGSSVYDLVSLGVGTGTKDYIFLHKILRNAEASGKSVSYYPIDISASMIQEATNRNIRDLFGEFRNVQFKMFPMVGNFEDVNKFKDILNTNHNNPRLIVLLNNSLGNFKEGQLLYNLYSFLDEEDYLLLGVQFHADYSNENLIKAYQNDQAIRFIFGPLEDAGYTMQDARLTYNVVSDVSDVPGSRTVVGKAIVNDHDIKEKTVQLFYSTKYDRNEFEKYVANQRFEIISNGTFDQSDEGLTVYSKYILKKAK